MDMKQYIDALSTATRRADNLRHALEMLDATIASDPARKTVSVELPLNGCPNADGKMLAATRIYATFPIATVRRNLVIDVLAAEQRLQELAAMNPLDGA